MIFNLIINYKMVARRVYRKKKRTMKRKARVTRRMPMFQMKTVKTSYQGTWAFTSTATSGFWKYYEATALAWPEFSEYATIFDEYKITNLKYTFRPRFDSFDALNFYNNSAIPGSQQLPLCYAHVIKDPASTRVPNGTYGIATINQFLENGLTKSYTLNKPFSVSFRPKILTQDFGGGTASTATASRWIRTTEDSVPHRGFHMFLQNNSLSANNPAMILDVFITYSIQFRGAR